MGQKGKGFKTHLLVVSVGARVDGRRQHRASRNSGEVELASGDGTARVVKGLWLGKLRGVVGN